MSKYPTGYLKAMFPKFSGRWASLSGEHQEQEARHQDGPHRHRHLRPLLAPHPHHPRSQEPML
jgi:hypothetical protein